MKSFLYKIGYLNHIKKHEQIEIKIESKKIQKNSKKPFSCEFCDKSFFTPSILERHTGIHTEGNPLKCDTCGKSYKYSGNLKVHERMHLEERMYKCNYVL